MSHLSLLHRARYAAALTGLVATVLTVGGSTPASAGGPLGDAQARAAALSKTVDRLTTQAEIASQRYDKAETLLSQAVAARGQADQALNAVQAKAAAAQVASDNRAVALYESGGSSGLLGAVLSGTDLVDMMNRYHIANAVMSYEAQSVHQDQSAVDAAAALDRKDAAASSRVTRLQVAASNEAGRVTALLAAQRKQLTTANATVKRIMREQQAAAAAAGAQDFASAVAAAGGTINLGGTTQAPNNIVAMAIAAARSRLGVPYVWGATGPDAFDCSGLTQWSYAHAGIQLPRVAADQYNAGPHPSLSHLLPGDLLFWATVTSNPATIHHVTMYLGNGMMIAAPHTGTVVQIQPVYMQGFIGATRPWA
jgi:cell wall-associated NlpC family hydrolase